MARAKPEPTVQQAVGSSDVSLVLLRVERNPDGTMNLMLEVYGPLQDQPAVVAQLLRFEADALTPIAPRLVVPPPGSRVI